MALRELLIEKGVFTADDVRREVEKMDQRTPDRKSTRLNSSHKPISYAVFCLKKKTKQKKKQKTQTK